MLFFLHIPSYTTPSPGSSRRSHPGTFPSVVIDCHRCAPTVPPVGVAVVEGGPHGPPAGGVLGPYKEGDVLTVTCLAHGGES